MSACVRPMMTGCYQHHTWSSLARFSSVVLYDPRSLAVGARHGLSLGTGTLAHVVIRKRVVWQDEADFVYL